MARDLVTYYSIRVNQRLFDYVSLRLCPLRYHCGSDSSIYS